MLVHDQHSVWGVMRNRRGNPVGSYSLFRKKLDASGLGQPWSRELPVRPRAMLKSGKLLLLGVTPIDIPADDPHAAYDGRMGGSLWVCAASDGTKLAEYALPAAVNWDGMAAADRRLYVSTANGRLVCMAPSDH